MLRALILTLCLTNAPTAAFALSCLPPNAAVTVDRMMAQHQDARIAIGTMTPRSAGNATDSATGEGARDLDYGFSGRILVQTAWRDISDMNVTARISCVASWCGAPPSTDLSMFILDETPAGHVLRLHPCNEHRFAPPTAEQESALVRCIENGRCSLDDFEAFAAH